MSTDTMAHEGFIVVDKALSNYEVTLLGMNEVFRTREEAQRNIQSEIHRAFWDHYEVRPLPLRIT